MFNQTLLEQTLSIQTVTYNTEKMRAFIVKYFERAPYLVDLKEDEHGNIYVKKGSANVYPCMVAHTDTVHAINNNAVLYRMGDCLMAWDHKANKQYGTGGDDKVGIAITLMFCDHMPNFKAAFFVDEEKGCIGSSKADMDFFKDVAFVLQCDRRGSDDLTETISGEKCFDDDFLDAVKPIMATHKRRLVPGMTTDAGKLLSKGLGLVAMNMSCGYFDPHSDKEIVLISVVEQTYNFCADMYRDLAHKQWENKKKPASTYSDSSYGSYGSRYANNSWNNVERVGTDLWGKEIRTRGNSIEVPCHTFNAEGQRQSKTSFLSLEHDYVYFQTMKAFSRIDDPRKAALYYRAGLIGRQAIMSSIMRDFSYKVNKYRSFVSYEQLMNSLSDYGRNPERLQAYMDFAKNEIQELDALFNDDHRVAADGMKLIYEYFGADPGLCEAHDIPVADIGRLVSAHMSEYRRLRASATED